jgi:hypothetical protein
MSECIVAYAEQKVSDTHCGLCILGPDSRLAGGVLEEFGKEVRAARSSDCVT